MDEIVSFWKANITKISESVAQALASPANQSFLFPDFEIAIQVENMFLTKQEETTPSSLVLIEYANAKEDLEPNLVKLIKSQSAPSKSNIPVALEGGDSDPDDQAEADTHSTLNNNYDHYSTTNTL